VVSIKPFFTLLPNKRHEPPAEAQSEVACVPPRDLGIMEDFIERTLRERRRLEAALADISAKHERITSSGQERTLLERMIAGLTHEIVLRKNPRGDRNDVAV